MDIEKGLGYLTIQEQKDSKWSSPIVLKTFPLHQERQQADRDIDIVESRLSDEELLHPSERASLLLALASAKARSDIARHIAIYISQAELLKNLQIPDDISGLEDG